VTVFQRPFPLNSLLLAAVSLTVAAGFARAQDNPRPAAVAPSCSAPDDMTRLMNPLARTAKRIAGGEAVKIVAIGSSSTARAGASSPHKSYPSRLAVELKEKFPDQEIVVINRGVNGEEAADMLARLDEGVLAEKPDLILWQVGTNAVLRDNPIGPANSLIFEGLRRMKASGADVVLIDPQFAPKVLAKSEAETMVATIAATAKSQNVDLFRRFAVMRHWRHVARIPFETFISPDELHMNDWSYGCVAKLMADAIAEAATRTTLTAGVSAR
jgi:acyl-CoA thioesterase I